MMEAVLSNDYLVSGILAAAGTWVGGTPPACASKAFWAASDAGGLLGSVLVHRHDGHDGHDGHVRFGVIADMCSRIPGMARRMVAAVQDALVPLVMDYDSARHVYLCGLHALFGTCTRDADAGVLEDVKALLDGWPWQATTRFRLDDLTRGDLNEDVRHRAFDCYENGWDVLGYAEYAMMWLAQAGRMEALIGLLQALDRDGELHRGHRGVLRLCMCYSSEEAADCILAIGFDGNGAYVVPAEEERGGEDASSSYLMHRLMCNAAEHGSLEAVRMCMAHPDYVSHPASVCDATVTYAFLKAVEGGHGGVARELLQRGADAGARDGQALSMAALAGDVELVRTVLTAPRNPPRADCQKSQIAFWALWNGRAEVARTLLTWPEHPARLNAIQVYEILHMQRTVAIDVLKQIDGLREVVEACSNRGVFLFV